MSDTWVCDGCLATVTRPEIAEMVDGEHVLCHRCANNRRPSYGGALHRVEITETRIQCWEHCTGSQPHVRVDVERPVFRINKGAGMKYRKRPAIVEAIQYLGFDVNGAECELFLGDDFNSHIVTKNQIELVGGGLVLVGDYMVRTTGHGLVTVWSHGAFEGAYEAME